MTEDFYIDDLKKTDIGGLLNIIRSGTDYPFWYKSGLSAERAAGAYLSLATNRSKDQFKAIRSTTGQLIGCITLVGFDPATGDAEIGYFVHKDYQGQGIAKKAAFAVIWNAVQNDGLKSLHTTVDPQKNDSLKLLIDLGLSVVGFVADRPEIERDDNRSEARVVVKATETQLRSALDRYFFPKPKRDIKIRLNVCNLSRSL